MWGQTVENTDARIAALLARLADLAGPAQANAQRLDPEGGFPSADVDALRAAGALHAVVPAMLGGLGIGTEAQQAWATAHCLHLIGGGSLALGRIFEGHLNAVRLVMRIGKAAQRRACAADAQAGHLHALWVTDGADPVRYISTAGGIELAGEKIPCSGAGQATRAVVTALDPSGGTRLLLLPLGRGEIVGNLPAGLQGVRGAATGRVDFTGIRHEADAVFGAAGDYLREPDFSTGAWRASAVAAGGLASLVEAARAELVARGRAGHPQQRERLGRMFVHEQAAWLWLRNVAPIAENADGDPDHAVASVNLARIAIEQASLDTIQLVQRSLGLSAFVQSNPVERICRDLATYLRQPAADEVLAGAAAYFTDHPPGSGLA